MKWGGFKLKLRNIWKRIRFTLSIIEANSAKIFRGFARGVNAEALMPFEWQRSVLIRNNARDRSIKINSVVALKSSICEISHKTKSLPPSFPLSSFPSRSLISRIIERGRPRLQTR